VRPSDIDAIILTHAHIDHSGYIPRLIQEGFKGKVYSTFATKDLCGILLPDSGYLMEEEAEYLNRKRKTKHSPALPLYTMKQAEKAMESFHGVEFRKPYQIAPDLSFEFRYAGHILGAASVIIRAGNTTVAFTGDIGRQNDSVFFPPEPLPPMDYLITESTYGNRLHKKTNVLDDLEKIINETYSKKGVLLIPSFAVGRAQAFMYFLLMLKRQNRIPTIPMYLNSPMATNVNDLLIKYRDLHRLSEGECVEMCSLVKYVRSVEESIKLNERKGPMIIISASGMLSGGRVLHHLKAFAPYQRNTILLAGFQSAGTRGEALEHGATEVKVHGEYVPVHARVISLDNVSAHADYQEIIQWFSQSNLAPKKVFVTHGEASAADDLRRRLNEKFGWDCSVPSQDTIVKLK
ncbi:MAG: MBL fold metallo-hydrolase RNA specificity domain-containing protein, partial [Pseudobdellovibrio sp.]